MTCVVVRDCLGACAVVLARTAGAYVDESAAQVVRVADHADALELPGLPGLLANAGVEAWGVGAGVDQVLALEAGVAGWACALVGVDAELGAEAAVFAVGGA